jgi:hypothetical protein
VSALWNLSTIHPRLMIDTRPALAEDDPRVIAKVVGRTVFALVDAPPTREEIERHPTAPPIPAMGQIPLGKIRAEEVTHVQRVVHVSTGPNLVWLVYRLGWFVEIAKPARAYASAEEAPDESAAPTAPRFFFFRYVVDADTGDVLEDARAPIVSRLPFPVP